MLVVGTAGFLLIAMQIFSAWVNDFLTPSQMIKRGFDCGLPLIAHEAIWGDLLAITPLSAWIVYGYSDRWSNNAILIGLSISLAITFAMVIFWVSLTKNGLPEAHAHGGKLTSAGLFHAMFMTGSMAIIILFFFYSGVSQKAATIVAILLGIHVFCGTHIPLGLIGPSWFPNRPHKDVPTWIVILTTWGLLAWRCLTIR